MQTSCKFLHKVQCTRPMNRHCQRNVLNQHSSCIGRCDPASPPRFQEGPLSLSVHVTLTYLCRFCQISVHHCYFQVLHRSLANHQDLPRHQPFSLSLTVLPPVYMHKDSAFSSSLLGPSCPAHKTLHLCTGKAPAGTSCTFTAGPSGCRQCCRSGCRARGSCKA